MRLKNLSIKLQRFYKSTNLKNMEKTNFQKTQFKFKDERPNFPKNEEEVLAYWESIKAFDQQLEKTKHLPHYTFYDGPPFATGTPHYGHICAGTIKDVITRYQSMNGFHVERRFGWDCHGLPIEYEIDKKLNITNRKEIVEMGIDKYNAECRSIVMRYSGLWREVVNRLGRWIDFDNDYKTMDLSFMESVWWVFKQIFDKGLVYRGSRIMPYSNKCTTVLSNFEAGLNYQDVSDPAIVVTFPCIGEEDVSFIAWTTTPWTLPSNLALAVNPEFEYVKIRDINTGNKYILAKCRLVELYKSGAKYSNVADDVKIKKTKPKKKKKKNKKKKDQAKEEEIKETEEEETTEDKEEFEILETFKGKDIIGKEYVPLFDYYYKEMKPRGCFKVLGGDFVTSDSGTGIVHCAPAYGEEDYKVCRANDLITPDDPCVSVDEDGLFLDVISDFKKMYIKDADKPIIKRLKEENRIIKHSNIKHSYPMCWRSKAPLIYKAINTWFIKVTDVKENLLANNKKSVWVPKQIQDKRFHNWLENAEDWCFSRNRFWGNPIPLWVSEDGEEVVCVGSIAELKKLANLPDDYEVNDLHRESIDHITIPSQQGKGQLRRIEEVFDCWFESGSMPYASFGYPNKMNKEEFEKRFPANFIGEGLDQTRGWFYTLNVIATAVFNDTPYKNLIVNGIVCNEKGEKLSKSSKNYPDPMVIVNQLGADAIRLYLMNSPLVKADSLNFKEKGVSAVVKDIFIPWYNLCRLLLQEINRFEVTTQEKFVYNEALFTDASDFELANLSDKWILAKTQNIIKFVHQEFDNYRLYTVLDKQLKYLDNLANWYVKLNKTRFRGGKSIDDARLSLNVFFYCFFSCISVMAPYVPFIVEYFYQNLRMVIPKGSKFQEDSIHFLRIPHHVNRFENEGLVHAFEVFQNLMTSVRKVREKNKVNLKQAVGNIKVMPRGEELGKNFRLLEDYIKEEGNIVNVEFSDDFNKYCSFSLMPNHRTLGALYGGNYSKIRPALMKLPKEKVEEFLKNKTIELKFVLDGKEELLTFGEDDMFENPKIIAKPKSEEEHIAGDAHYCYSIDFTMTEELRRMGLAREITSRIQKQRKEAKTKIDDKITLILELEEGKLKEAYNSEKASIVKTVKKNVVLLEECVSTSIINSKEHEINGEKVIVHISLAVMVLNKNEMEGLEANEESRRDLETVLMGYNTSVLRKQEKISVLLNGKEYVLEKNKHYEIR